MDMRLRNFGAYGGDVVIMLQKGQLRRRRRAMKGMIDRSIIDVCERRRCLYRHQSTDVACQMVMEIVIARCHPDVNPTGNSTVTV